ncbi:hypothetical protein AB0F15_00585 [Amycolatopsis sp. NPDC026612]|uniref:hypothetical protein n=1 Tax=Amycolatopsis sp. NPDC026612 TaxID=3155466 RepID=UPI0033F2674E
MRRITATIGALVLTTGVLLGATGTASAQEESTPGRSCVGSSLAMFATTALCVVDREIPVLVTPGA